MSFAKLSLTVLAAAVVFAPSIAEAQGYTQRGTRNGAIAGAIVGGIIGDQNNEALAGVAIGGLVGGVAGRAVGRSRDAQYWNGGYYGNSYQNYTYRQPVQYRGGYSNYGVQYVPTRPVYRSNYYGGNVYRGNVYRGGGYGSSCGRW